jgi:hypothetical protein
MRTQSSDNANHKPITNNHKPNNRDSNLKSVDELLSNKQTEEHEESAKAGLKKLGR